MFSDSGAERNLFTNRAHTYFEDEEASPEHENVDEDSEELRPLSEAGRRKPSMAAFRHGSMREGEVVELSGTSSRDAFNAGGARFIRELSVDGVRTSKVQYGSTQIRNSNQAVVKVSELLTPKIVSRSSGLNRTGRLRNVVQQELP